MQVGEVELSLGAVVTLQPEEDDEEEQGDGEQAAEPPLGLVQALWQSTDGERWEGAWHRLILLPAAWAAEQQLPRGPSVSFKLMDRVSCATASSVPSIARTCPVGNVVKGFGLGRTPSCRREAGAGAAAGARRRDGAGRRSLAGRALPHYQAGDQVGRRQCWCG
jgi:hypothetical protein